MPVNNSSTTDVSCLNPTVTSTEKWKLPRTFIKTTDIFTLSDEHSKQHCNSSKDDRHTDVICDSFKIPDDDEVICIDSENETKDDSFKEMELRMFKLRMELQSVRQDCERKLQIKDDKIQCLENELMQKQEELTEMSKLAELNVELESRITLMLNDQKEYEKEVIRKKETDKRREQMEREEKEKKEQGEREKEETEKEVPIKHKQIRKDQNKTTKQRKTSKKNAVDCEKDEIDAYFVEDESDVEFIKEEKLQQNEHGELEEKPESKEGNSIIVEAQTSANKSRHSIRKLMTGTKLKGQTKQAAKEEKDRIERAKKEHDKHLRVVETSRNNKEPITKQLVLAFKEDTKTPLVEVNSKLIRKLKPHQVDAVEFIWDNIIESVDRLKENADGSGCILAHCMGLGKTLSVIALIHTLLRAKFVGFKHCLIVCPLNTVLNWQFEWEKWLEKKDRITVFELASCKNNHQRTECLAEWRKTGGVMITGYQLFRILINYVGRSKKTKEIIDKALINPGPDVVVCDEGHILKNDASAISKCMNQIRTKRRILLTGTPLQNNLVEYHCMVSFVKPNLLGSRREFNNRFVNPITNGQHLDSTSFDVKLMKRRAHILHSMLDGCVQRRDYSALTKFLPPKYEYVLSIRLSPLQIELYEKYLELFRPEASCINYDSGTRTEKDHFRVKGSSLFTDYQNLMRIWTHPWLLKLDEARQEKKPFTEYDDDLESVLFTSSSEDECEDQLSENIDHISSSSSSSSLVDDKPTSVRRKSKRVRHQRETCSKKLTSEISTAEAEKMDVLQSETSWRTRKTKAKCSAAQNGKRKQSKIDQQDLIHNSKVECQATGVKRCRRSETRDQKEDTSHVKTDLENHPDVVETTNTAKLYAGEVIKQWQTHSRRTGNEEEFTKKKEALWWSKYMTDEMKNQLELSGKLVIMFEIIRMAEAVGDKVLLFSQSILTLDLIEEFLALKDQEVKSIKGKRIINRWEKDEDYCRMDGTTGVHNRKKLTCNFNSIKNKRMRLFLISTKAGGLGINLDSANRVIIFNASWNPSHDIQSIFRVYRFGQNKPVFVYRLLAQGTMEEKIYERQVTKETLAQRVIDERQIDRHFTSNDLQELYHFKPDRLDNPNRDKQPTPAVPKDMILADLLSSHKEWIVQYHEHDSLLENRPDEELNEEERKNAWEEYEREKQGLGTFHRTILPNMKTANMFGYINTGLVPVRPVNLMPSLSLPGSLAGTHVSGRNTHLNMQIAQLPMVVQEIIKYNPSITSDDLNNRLQTFLVMNKYQGQVPGFALDRQKAENGNPSHSVPSISNSVNSSQGIPSVQTEKIISSHPSSDKSPSTPQVTLPSRLPIPGPVPASRK